MKSPALYGLAWVASLGLAFLLGTRLRTEAPAREGRAAPEVRREEVAAPPVAGPVPDAPEGAAPAAAGAPRAAGPKEPAKPVVLEPGMNVADVSTLLMRYAESKLAEGPEGHLELLRELDRMIRDRSFLELMRDERELAPLAYPWIRFLVAHERQIVDMMETLYRTAAEDPRWFEALASDDPLELFTEGVAVMLPGIVDDERLARFREYAQAILSRPKESLPEALQGVLRDLQQNLELWGPPLTPEQVVALLADPAQPMSMKIRILSQADPSTLKGLDLNRIIADGIREGDLRAVYVIRRLPPGTVDLPALDQAFLDAMAAAAIHSFNLNSYLEVTGRRSWGSAKPFLETGLARGGAAAEGFAQGLAYLRDFVPAEFVRGVLATYALSDDTRGTLEACYGLD